MQEKNTFFFVLSMELNILPCAICFSWNNSTKMKKKKIESEAGNSLEKELLIWYHKSDKFSLFCLFRNTNKFSNSQIRSNHVQNTR